MPDTVTLTTLLPCLNEAKHLPFCMGEARLFSPKEASPATTRRDAQG